MNRDLAAAIDRWQLRRNGRAWTGQCPFCGQPEYSHSNPFTLFDNGNYYCHACERKGRIGDAPKTAVLPIKVVPTYHGLHYPQAWVGHTEAIAYFGSRGLTPQTIARFRLGWDGHRFTIPCYGADGSLAGIKRRKDPDNAADQGPKYLSVKGSRAAIFNEVALASDDLVICEGEIDAMTLAQAGIAAVCSTAGVAHWLDAWLPKLAGKRITIWFDSDKPGRAGALRLARRLEGVAAEVRIVTEWAWKDPNEGLING